MAKGSKHRKRRLPLNTSPHAPPSRRKVLHSRALHESHTQAKELKPASAGVVVVEKRNREDANVHSKASAEQQNPSKRRQGQSYWDSMARKYDHEIYDSLHESTNSSVLLELLDRIANRKKEALCIDFGCGVGKYLAALSSRFGSVFGTDLSQALLDKAFETVVWSGKGRSRCHKLKNVKLGQADLSKTFDIGRKADAGICQNVLLEPNSGVQDGILRNVSNALKPEAKLVMLVPSLESAIHVGQVLPQQMKSGMLNCPDCDPMMGHLPREGVLTQHFTRETINMLLRRHQFSMLSIQKLEYGWQHEFGDSMSAAAPSDLPPWDWLILAQKIKS